MTIAGRCRYLAAMIDIRLTRVVVLVLLVSASPAETATKKPAPAPAKEAAPATQSLGKFDGWAAYASQDKVGRVCYLAGEAPQKGPTGKPAMAMVTHRPAEKIANVVSFIAGYPLKEGSEVALDIGSAKFELFTKDDSAWARTAELDKSIVAVLAKGKQAVVKSVPQRGPPTTEIYPLAGFAKALAAIDKACGVKREGGSAPSSPRRHHKKAATGGR